MRAILTKSRAGHWTVTVRGADGRLIYRENLISTLQQARDIARRIKASARP